MSDTIKATHEFLDELARDAETLTAEELKQLIALVKQLKAERQERDGNG